MIKRQPITENTLWAVGVFRTGLNSPTRKIVSHDMETIRSSDSFHYMKSSRQNLDKLNRIDFKWFIVRSLPHQEEKLKRMLTIHQKESKNILEVYCPTNSTVNVMQDGKETKKPLFAGFVFVLSTQEALVEFINAKYPEGALIYKRKNSDNIYEKTQLLTIPEEQMRTFMDFNDNYAEHVVVLERPYSDYAFNPKTGEPNEIVKVIEGPLKGRIGYFTRFRRDKRLVFNMKSFYKDNYFAVSIPNIWNFRVVRLHNAENSRQPLDTRKERAADMLIGIIQSCGYGDNSLAVFHEIMKTLAMKPSIIELCRNLQKQGEEELCGKLSAIGTKEARMLMELARYEKDNPGYIEETWNKLVIRPFLTPTYNAELSNGTDEKELRHPYFTEIIRRVNIEEQVYYPSKDKEENVTSGYYAHVGMIDNKKKGEVTVFANWDKFLGEYFLTAGKANEYLVGGTFNNVTDTDTSCDKKKEKLLESFRNFAPTLYNVLTDKASEVKAIKDLKIGNHCLNVLAITSTRDNAGAAKELLTTTGIRICKEINTTTHLAVWRRYLRTVWLNDIRL